MAAFAIVSSAVFIALVKDALGNSLPYLSNPPVYYRVNENAAVGYIVGSVTGKDVEIGDTLTLSLDYIGKELFDIVDSGGAISFSGNSPLVRYLRLKKKLDRELKNMYDFKIIIKDNYRPSFRESSRNVILIVRDVNDNPPIFQGTPYRSVIKENTPGNLIFQANAKDADYGSAERILYSFSDDCKIADCQPFLIDSTSGKVSLNSSFTLDYEKQKQYILYIIAKDRGSPSLSSTAYLFITVTDEDDMPPQFERTLYSAIMNTSIPFGFNVVQTKAFDGDRDMDHPIKYAIIGGDDGNYFKIDNSTGLITTNSSMDGYSGDNVLELIVKATEIGTNTSSNTTVFITIEGITNGNEFQFTQSQYNFTVNELAESGTLLGQITAAESDIGRFVNITYKLFGDGAEKFLVNPNNGTIFVVGSLDFESRQSYSLELEAKYGGNRTSIPVNVFIIDINDNTPIFDPFPTWVNLDENKETVFSFIVKATDKDSGNNSVIRYSIVGGDPLNNFTINVVSGEIKNAGAPDFKTNFSLVIMAADLGSTQSRKTTETLFIKVNIFVVEDYQRVRLTLGVNDTDFVRRNIDEIMKALGDVTCLEFKVERVQNHLQGNGKYDLSRTDIFMYALDPKTRNVIGKDTVSKLIDSNYSEISERLQKYKVSRPSGTEEPVASTYESKLLFFIVVALGGLLLTVFPCSLSTIYVIKRRQRRKLLAVKDIAKDFAHIYETIVSIESEEQNRGIITPSGTFYGKFCDDSLGSVVVTGSFYESIVSETAEYPEADMRYSTIDETDEGEKLRENGTFNDMFRDDSLHSSSIVTESLYESVLNVAADHSDVSMRNSATDEIDEGGNLRENGTVSDMFSEDSSNSSIVSGTIHESAVNESADYPDEGMLNSATDETDEGERLRENGTFNDIFCEDSPDSSIVPARTIHERSAVNEAADYPDTDMLNSAIDETDGEIKENVTFNDMFDDDSLDSTVVVPGTSNENPDGDMLNSATVEIDEGEKLREDGTFNGASSDDLPDGGDTVSNSWTFLRGYRQ